MEQLLCFLGNLNIELSNKKIEELGIALFERVPESNKKFEKLGIALFERAQDFLSQYDEKALAGVMPKLFHDFNFGELIFDPIYVLRNILCYSATPVLLVPFSLILYNI